MAAQYDERDVRVPWSEFRHGAIWLVTRNRRDYTSGTLEHLEDGFVVLVRAPNEEWWFFEDRDWVHSNLKWGALGRLTVREAVTNMRSLLVEDDDHSYFTGDFVFEKHGRIYWQNEICNLQDPASLGLES